MKFECVLKTSSKSIRSSHVVLHLMNAGYKVNKQKMTESDSGGNLIEITSTSANTLSKDQIHNELLTIANCEVVRFTIIDELQQRTVQEKTVQENISTNHKSILKTIGSRYPRISTLVKDYAKSLDDSTRSMDLQSLGEKVGSSVYNRSYSLGSPLKLPKTLHRELKPALEDFCKVKMSDREVKLFNCPFCDPYNGQAAPEFITGFIKGFLKPNKAVRTVDVNHDISASTKMDEYIFTIRY